MAQTMNSERLLQDLETWAERHLQQAIRHFQNLSESELSRKPGPEEWSAAQCLAHLNSYGTYYLPLLEKAVKESPLSGERPFKSTWLGDYFTRLMLPGEKMKKMKSPRPHRPDTDLVASAVVAEFIRQQEWMVRLIREARGKDLNAVRIPISISRFIRMKTGDVFRFMIAHQERHIVQANAALGKLSSPTLRSVA